MAGLEKVRIRLRVNGEEREVLAPVHHTLLEVLREELGLTGTKHGCELGECGTCTVLRGRPARALLPDAARRVRGPRDHAPSRAWPRAARCTRCSRPSPSWAPRSAATARPGFLLVAEALLRENPRPTRQEIAEATAGNLCRCTGYLKIFEAIELAAARMRGETRRDRRPADAEAVRG